MSTLSGKIPAAIPFASDPGDAANSLTEPTDHLLVSLPEWRVIASSVLGSGHQKRGQPCQDAHAWCILEPGIVMAAIADGAGSATRSDLGAQVATQTSIEYLKHQLQDRTTRLDEALLQTALETAQQAIAAEAISQDIEIRQLASTLLVMVATPQQVAVGQVGDGAIVIGDREGNLTTLTFPDNGEYANETTFIISPGAIANAQIQLWEGKISHFALFSDGLQRLALKFPEAIPHTPFFSPLFRFIDQIENLETAQTQLQEFLGHPRITERTDDDLTIVLGTLL